jgi:hypothetical protein
LALSLLAGLLQIFPEELFKNEKRTKLAPLYNRPPATYISFLKSANVTKACKNI